MNRGSAPLIPYLLLRLALDPGIGEMVLGDLEEELAERTASEGRHRAVRWYWSQALTSSTGGRRRLPGSRRPPRRPHDRRASLTDSIGQDLRHTLRSFAKSPGFVGVAVVTLALGIGATTGVFSFAHWLMLRPVPGVAHQGRLALVTLGTELEGGGLRVSMLSYPNFKDFAARLTQVETVAGYSSSMVNASVGRSGAIELPIEYTTASYADVLGLEPQLGRWFTTQEDDPGAPAYVAVISAATWRSMYAGDPQVLGRELLVNDRPFEIVGVAAAGFEGALLEGGVGAWLPGAAFPWANHYEEMMDYTQRDSGGYYEFVARVAPGASWQRVQDELDAAAGWLAERYPEANSKFATADGSAGVRFRVYPGIGTRPWNRPMVASTLRLMLGVVALVLLIACANVANLLLVRGVRRSGEIAVRKSLGAGRARLLRQQVIEGMSLWALGGVAGLGVALLLMRLFAGAELVGATVVESVPLDLRVLGFASLLALATGLAFSLLPAWVASRVDAARTLQGGTDGSRGRRSRLRTVFGAAQLGASLTLLVGALLFARTIGNMASVDVGLDPTNVTATFLYPSDIGYSPAQAAVYFERLDAALAAHPETAAVARCTTVPFYGFQQGDRVRSAADPTAEYKPTLYNRVTEDFFEMLSIPLLKGRAFTADEVRQGAQVMVIGQALATELFGDTDPLGRTVEVPRYRSDPLFYDVVGVVGDLRDRDLTEAPRPTYYVPMGRSGAALRAIVLVKTRPGANGQEIVRATVAEASPSLAPRRVESLEEAVHQAAAQSRLLARLLAVLATVAAALSAVGLYGMVSAATAQRTFELGVRIALGSSPGRILGLVLRSATPVVGLGLAAGLFGAWSLSRVIESRLYGVERLDPVSWAAAVLMLIAVALAAALVPARRAGRIDPIETLRCR